MRCTRQPTGRSWRPWFSMICLANGILSLVRQARASVSGVANSFAIARRSSFDIGSSAGFGRTNRCTGSSALLPMECDRCGSTISLLLPPEGPL
uniref:Putative secreted peptide n=1 Tax=Anopheles braziliensis TaxID=58242 RepID=A0A2M3ZWM1_9DIPT